MTTPTDTQIADAFERRAARATTPADGEQRVQMRLRVRRNRRRTAAASMAAMSLFGVGAAVLNLGEPVAPDARVASTGNDTERSEPPPAARAEGLPRLTLALDGFPLTGADVGRFEVTDEEAGPPAFSHFQSFRPGPEEWAGPSLYVYTVPPGAPFGIGEESPPESTTVVDVNGRTGYLSNSGSHRSLGWRTADGTAAYVFAPDMDPDDLVAVGRSMTLRPGAGGWTVGDLPDGMVPVLDQANTRLDATDSHVLTFEGPGGRIELHSYSATAVDLEGRIADYSVGAVVTDVTVAGHPGAVTRSGHDVRVLWYDADAGSANYMIIDSAAGADVDRVLSGLEVLTESEWESLLATVGSSPRPPSGGSTASTTAP